MYIALLLLTAQIGGSDALSPLARIDAAKKAGKEVLAITVEQATLSATTPDGSRREHTLAECSPVYVLRRQKDRVEVAVLRFGDVLQTGWVPRTAVRQGWDAMEFVGNQMVKHPNTTRPRVAAAYLLLESRAVRQIPRSLEEVGRVCQEALRTDPKCVEARVMLAIVNGRFDAHDEAIA